MFGRGSTPVDGKAPCRTIEFVLKCSYRRSLPIPLRLCSLELLRLLNSDCCDFSLFCRSSLKGLSSFLQIAMKLCQRRLSFSDACGYLREVGLICP